MELRRPSQIPSQRNSVERRGDGSGSSAGAAASSGRGRHDANKAESMVFIARITGVPFTKSEFENQVLPWCEKEEQLKVVTKAVEQGNAGQDNLVNAKAEAEAEAKTKAVLCSKSKEEIKEIINDLSKEMKDKLQSFDLDAWFGMAENKDGFDAKFFFELLQLNCMNREAVMSTIMEKI